MFLVSSRGISFSRRGLIDIVHRKKVLGRFKKQAYVVALQISTKKIERDENQSPGGQLQEVSSDRVALEESSAKGGLHRL